MFGPLIAGKGIARYQSANEEWDRVMAAVDIGLGVFATVGGFSGAVRMTGFSGQVAFAQTKIPKAWGAGRATRGKGKGVRWSDPDNPSGNTIRIDKGHPNAEFPAQRVDQVRINYSGRPIGRSGHPLPNGRGAEAHIPLYKWLQWNDWYKP